MVFLKNKTALITGSTSGIGLGIANQMASEGYDILLNGFGNSAEIEKIKSELFEKYGIKIFYVNADLTKKNDIKYLVEEGLNYFGHIDVLVNNAGTQYTAPVEEFPDDKWELILNLNLSSAFYLIKEVMPYMQKNNWGRIINIASVHGLVASAHKAAYVAAKHGLLGLTKVVALETAKTNITCNAICPGWVYTPLVEKQIQNRVDSGEGTFEKLKKDLVSEKQPSEEFVSVEQIGKLCLYLADESTTQLRGAAIPVDGAWTIQ